MTWFSKKEPIKERPLLETMSEKLTENSKLVKGMVKSSKQAIVPVSKILDYAAVSVASIVIYKVLLYQFF